MFDQDDARPILEHLPSEFMTWLWFATEDSGGSFILEDLGGIDCYVEDRIAFRNMEDDKSRTVLTGENAANTLEARAALAGGRVVKEIRLIIKREDREYSVTLRGPLLDMSGAKLPGMVKSGTEEVLYDRMYMFEELHSILGALLSRYAKARTADNWKTETVPAMKAWIAEALEAVGDSPDAGLEP